MSSLRTLQDAFAELERQADAMAAATDRPAAARSWRRWERWDRRVFVPVAAMVGVALVAGAVAAGVALWPNGAHRHDQVTTAPAASLTLWKAVTAPCPPHVSAEAAAGAVLGYGGGCLQLVDLETTFQSPLHAQAVDDNGRWVVDVILTEQYTSELARVTRSIVGDQLAIVNNATVLSAATVMQPITFGHMQIVTSSEAQARHLAQALSGPAVPGRS